MSAMNKTTKFVVLGFGAKRKLPSGLNFQNDRGHKQEVSQIQPSWISFSTSKSKRSVLLVNISALKTQLMDYLGSLNWGYVARLCCIFVNVHMS